MENCSTPTEISKKKRSPFHALKKKTHAVTKGPRLLGTRVRHLLRDEFFVDVTLRKAPQDVTREIVGLEVLAAYHCWLRGVQAFFAIIIFILSLASSKESDYLVNWTIFGLSIAAIVIIVKIYAIKAQYAGLTNVLYEDGRNVFTSPFLFQMLAEILVWLIQTPPIILFWESFFELLNYFLFVRLYVLVLYIHNAGYVYRSFCRAMTAVVSFPLNVAFTMRTLLVYRRVKVAVIVPLSSWFSIACLYSRAESVPLHDGMWFAFQTMSTVGYGDLSPTTTAGRVVVQLSWLMSFLLIAYFSVCVHASLTEDPAEYNMYLLMRCHELSHTVWSKAARVIQTAWRLHRARRQLSANRSFLHRARALIFSLSLARHIRLHRAARQNFSAATRLLRDAEVRPRLSRWGSWERSASSFDGFATPEHARLDWGRIERRVEALEKICGRLEVIIDAINASVDANPPSLAHSHV